jgi:hypothetical protein
MATTKTPTTTDPRSSKTRANRIATKLRSACALAWVLALAGGLVLCRTARADGTAGHKVVVRVEPISALALQGGDIELAVPQSPDGGPSSAIDASCSLGWLTNQAQQKITVASSLPDAQLPLTVEAFRIQGGSSVGSVLLGVAAQDLVVDLATGIGSCGLRYTAQASGLERPAPEVHVITYTLTDLR